MSPCGCNIKRTSLSPAEFTSTQIPEIILSHLELVRISRRNCSVPWNHLQPTSSTHRHPADQNTPHHTTFEAQNLQCSKAIFARKASTESGKYNSPRWLCHCRVLTHLSRSPTAGSKSPIAMGSTTSRPSPCPRRSMPCAAPPKAIG